MTRNKHNGFTLVELLIAMALMTFLLASLGLGMRASMQTYTENDKLANVTQTARVVLNRMGTEIRSARSVTATDTSVTIYPAFVEGGVSRIEYNYSNGTLYYNQYSGSDAASYALLTQTVVLTSEDDMVCIKNFAVSTQTGTDHSGNPAVANVIVTIQINCGDDVYPYTISVAPRRMQVY